MDTLTQTNATSYFYFFNDLFAVQLNIEYDCSATMMCSLLPALLHHVITCVQFVGRDDCHTTHTYIQCKIESVSIWVSQIRLELSNECVHIQEDCTKFLWHSQILHCDQALWLYREKRFKKKTHASTIRIRIYIIMHGWKDNSLRKFALKELEPINMVECIIKILKRLLRWPIYLDIIVSFDRASIECRCKWNYCKTLTWKSFAFKLNMHNFYQCKYQNNLYKSINRP